MDQILIPLTTIVFMIEPTSGRWFHKLNTEQQSRLLSTTCLPAWIRQFVLTLKEPTC